MKLTAEAKGSLRESKKSSVVSRRAIETAMMPIKSLQSALYGGREEKLAEWQKPEEAVFFVLSPRNPMQCETSKMQMPQIFPFSLYT